MLGTSARSTLQQLGPARSAGKPHAYQALVASGDPRLITNRDLRAEMAAFASRYTQGHENQVQGELLRAEMIDAMSESTGFLSVMRPSWLDPTTADPPDLESLLQNDRYLSHLATVSYITSLARSHFARGVQHAERILDLIDVELADDGP